MAELILSRREIVRSELGERIELPGKQYIPYLAVGGMIFAFATNAPLVALGLLLVGAHTALSVKVNESQLSPRLRRMHSLLAEDDGTDRTLEDAIHDALALSPKLARTVAEFVYLNAKRDRQNDWVIEWKGEEYLVCDFFQGAFENQYKAENGNEKQEESKTTGIPTRSPERAIGNNTKLNAIPATVAPVAIPVEAPTLVTVADAPKTVEQLAIAFPVWFQDWRDDLVQRTDSYTRIPFNALQRIWLKDNADQNNIVFAQVLQKNLPTGATIEDGFIYLKKTALQNNYVGMEVTPKSPPTTVRDRLLVGLQGKGEIDAQEFVDGFGEDKAEAIATLKALAVERVIRVDSQKRTVTLV